MAKFQFLFVINHNIVQILNDIPIYYLILPNDKIIFFGNTIYGNINNTISNLSPRQFYTIVKTYSTDTVSDRPSGGSTERSLQLTIQLDISNTTQDNILLLQFIPNTVKCSCDRADHYTNVSCTPSMFFQLKSGSTYLTERFGSIHLANNSVHTLNCQPEFKLNPLFIMYNDTNNFYTLFPFICVQNKNLTFNVGFENNIKFEGTTFTAQLNYTIKALCYTLA